MLWLCLGFSKLTCTTRPYSPGRRCSHSFYITLLYKLSPASCRHKAPRFKSVEQDLGSRCGPRDGAVRTSRGGRGPPRPVWTDPEPTPLLRRKHSPGGCKLELIVIWCGDGLCSEGCWAVFRATHLWVQLLPRRVSREASLWPSAETRAPAPSRPVCWPTEQGLEEGRPHGGHRKIKVHS